MTPLIITAALTGAETTREAQPALPITPDEIAEAAAECHAAGASIVHVHARRPDGSSSQDPALYAEIIAKVRQRCDIIVQVSTGGAVGMTAAERIAPVTLRPEMATLSMGSVNFGDDVFLNTPGDMRHFLDVMREHGVTPEFEIFDSGMLTTLNRWIKRGITPPSPCHVDLVLGVPGAMAGTAAALHFLLADLPEHATWAVAGIGAAQLSLGALAIPLGGHVRVGFEDNIFYAKGELATSNAQLVARIARIAAEHQRPLATPDQARVILGITPA